MFQDPYGSLDPLRNIENTIAEPLETHHVGSRTDRRKRVYELLDQVSLPRAIATRYPNELSGGQRQRVAVVRVIADNVAVMNKGRIVEAATTSEVFENPKQEYTKRLLDAIPGANIRLGA